MKPTILLLITTIALSACLPKYPDSIYLVNNGKSKYTLVIPEKASPEEERAANFLQEHIQKISGCMLPMVRTDEQVSKYAILISKCNEILYGDGFKIFTKGNNLFIEGGQARGCIYGVSELLEQYLGVKYYSPHFVVIPEQKDITIPAMQISGASPNTYRNINGDFVKDPNYKDFHRLHDISDMFAESYFVHTFHRLVPWQEYFKSNPEYFAFMNGKRIIDQLCLTNEDVFQLVLKKLEKEMLLQPEKQVWSVSQDDNFSYCQCENCMKIIEAEKSASGPIIYFANRVAGHFPDKIISTLAYQYSRQAPALTKPLDNLQIMLCTIELNRGEAIAGDPRSSSFLKDLEDWGKISKHIFLWDYTVNFSHHISPFPNLHTLQANIQLFAGNNVKEHFQQSNTGVGHEFSELKSWLLAKLLWNSDADVPALIHEFTDGFYGPAGVWIRKYINHLQDEILKTGEWLDIYGPPTNHQLTFLSAANIEQYNHYFNEAEKAVAEIPEFLLHVRTARMALQYAVMEIGKADMFGPRGWYEETADNFVPRRQMLEILESFYQSGIQSNAAFVNEAGFTVEQYYQSTNRFIDVQVKGNLAFRKQLTASPLPASKYSAGALSMLTNGVRGANDFKVHWLGWEARDFSLVLDLEDTVEATTIEISTLYDPKSWILHPASVTCMVSADGTNYKTIAKQIVEGDQRKEEVNRLFSFQVQNMKYRFVKFEIKGTLQLFDWHPSAGGGSWVFVDEIVVR
ncbi:MAG: DUF4838 domain-containing protein [Bacteroidales bacterium]|nr:DUF4838 domain-containing protein [Bacteroidales bacterium]